MATPLEEKILKAVNAAPNKSLEWNKLLDLLDRNEDRDLLVVLRRMESKGQAYRVLERVGETPETVLKIQLTKPPKAGEIQPAPTNPTGTT